MLVCQMVLIASAQKMEVPDLSNVFNQDVNQEDFYDPGEYRLGFDNDYGDYKLVAENQFADNKNIGEDMETAEFRGYGGGGYRRRYRGRRRGGYRRFSSFSRLFG